MNTLQIFQFQSHQLRIETADDGSILFNANDLCFLLGHSNPRRALELHVDKEDVTKCDTLTAGGKQSFSYIKEPGLWSLVLGSKTDKAKSVKRWVVSEVLPTIRQTGSYGVPADTQKHIENLQSEILEANPRLLDVLRLTRAGYSLKDISRLTQWAQATIGRDQKRLRDCGFKLRESREVSVQHGASL